MFSPPLGNHYNYRYTLQLVILFYMLVTVVSILTVLTLLHALALFLLRYLFLNPSKDLQKQTRVVRTSKASNDILSKKHAALQPRPTLYDLKVDNVKSSLIRKPNASLPPILPNAQHDHPEPPTFSPIHIVRRRSMGDLTSAVAKPRIDKKRRHSLGSSVTKYEGVCERAFLSYTKLCQKYDHFFSDDSQRTILLSSLMLELEVYLSYIRDHAQNSLSKANPESHSQQTGWASQIAELFAHQTTRLTLPSNELSQDFKDLLSRTNTLPRVAQSILYTTKLIRQLTNNQHRLGHLSNQHTSTSLLRLLTMLWAAATHDRALPADTSHKVLLAIIKTQESDSLNSSNSLQTCYSAIITNLIEATTSILPECGICQVTSENITWAYPKRFNDAVYELLLKKQAPNTPLSNTSRHNLEALVNQQYQNLPNDFKSQLRTEHHKILINEFKYLLPLEVIERTLSKLDTHAADYVEIDHPELLSVYRENQPKPI